ncbi:MAG: (Fe-S)-binding protein [Deltaproteobacteria bacterium]|nr:(Fe-S)-binding protein [Deltaproteobacteria bacterium]
MATRLGLQKWYPDALKQFTMYTVFDLLIKYIQEGRITLDPSRHPQLATYHDPCNYGRKSEMIFGHGYYEEPRWILNQCSANWVDMFPNRAAQFCCGAGGGAWLTPYEQERLAYGRKKVDQLKATGASLVVVSCHTCYDQFYKALRLTYGMENLQVKYLWAMVAEAIVMDQ